MVLRRISNTYAKFNPSPTPTPVPLGLRVRAPQPPFAPSSCGKSRVAFFSSLRAPLGHPCPPRSSNDRPTATAARMGRHLGFILTPHFKALPPFRGPYRVAPGLPGSPVPVARSRFPSAGGESRRWLPFPDSSACLPPPPSPRLLSLSLRNRPAAPASRRLPARPSFTWLAAAALPPPPPRCPLNSK